MPHHQKWVLLLIIISMIVIIFCSNMSNGYVIRLSDSYRIKVKNYNLYLDMHLPMDTYHGNVSITFSIQKYSSSFAIHSKVSKINHMEIKNGNGHPIILTDFKSEAETEALFITHELEPNNNYVFTVAFENNIKSTNIGFYKNRYRNSATFNPDGKPDDRMLYQTHFQTIYARNAFPCFDEPKLRATFDLTIVHPNNYNAFSNMPISKQNPSTRAGHTVTQFETSNNMPTYTFAFGLNQLTRSGGDNQRIKLYTADKYKPYTDYALEVAEKLLQFFEKYFNISQPIVKLDMLAVDNLKVAGQENWGLITYSPEYIVRNPKKLNPYERIYTATLIAHETSHLYFSNYVTYDWWDGAWIIEGLATYLPYVALEHIHPTYDLWNLFYELTQTEAIWLDLAPNAQSLKRSIEHNDQVRTALTRLSYRKGAALLRMLASLIPSGTATFQDVLTQILNKNAYGIINTDILTGAIHDLVKQHNAFYNTVSVKTLLNEWLEYVGFPVVYVELNYTGTMRLTQKRFSYSKSKDQESTNRWWWIPISFTKGSNLNFENDRTPKFWMPNNAATFITEYKIDPDDFVIVNLYNDGYYRVNYDLTGWRLIINALHTKEKLDKIPTANRITLIDDSLEFANASQLSYMIPLNVTNYLSNEIDKVGPWLPAERFFMQLSSAFNKHSVMMYLKHHVQTLINETFKNFHEEQYDVGYTYGRSAIMRIACYFEHPYCVNMFKFDYAEQMKPNVPEFYAMDISVRKYGNCAAIKFGGIKEWNFAMDLWKAATSQTDKTDIYYAISCARNLWMIDELINKAMWNLDASSTIELFEILVNNPIAKYAIYRFYYNNQLIILDKWKTNFMKFLKIFMKKLSYDYELADFNDLLKLYKKEEYQGSDKIAAAINENKQFRETNHEMVYRWLREKYDLNISVLKISGYNPI